MHLPGILDRSLDRAGHLTGMAFLRGHPAQAVDLDDVRQRGQHAHGVTPHVSQGELAELPAALQQVEGQGAGLLFWKRRGRARGRRRALPEHHQEQAVVLGAAVVAEDVQRGAESEVAVSDSRDERSLCSPADALGWSDPDDNKERPQPCTPFPRIR